MIEGVVWAYVRIILQFLAELYVFYAFILFRRPRTERFVIKLVGGLAAVAAIAFGVSFFYYFFGSSSWGRMIVYIFLFAVTVAHARLCFNDESGTIVFCCSIAYAAQNMVYKLFLLFWCAGERLYLFDGWGQNFSLYYRLVYYAFFIVAAAVVCFAFIRPQVNRLPQSRINVRLMAIAVFVLFITIILCSLEDVYFAAYSLERENKYAEYGVYVLRQTGNIFSVMCCGAVLALTSQTLVDRELKREVEYLQYTISQGQRQYEMSKDTMDMINIKYHDLKKMIDSRLPDVVSKADLENVLRGISVYDAVAETGNTSLDVVLTEKKLYCDRHGVRFTYIADGGCLSFMDGVDIYSLFGNILDNAIENVMKAPDPEERDISLDIRRVGDMVSVHSENYCVGDVRIVGGLPVTTKENTDEHGFGTRSIRRIAELYGGDATFAKYGSRFTVDLLIPMPEAA